MNSIFDGIQRPLKDIADATHSIYIPKGWFLRKWMFRKWKAVLFWNKKMRSYLIVTGGKKSLWIYSFFEAYLIWFDLI